MRLPDHLRRGCAFSDSPRLAALTTAGVGGRAAGLAEPLQGEAVVALVAHLARESIPFRVIGAGSNVLAPDEGLSALLVGTRRLRAVRTERAAPDRLTAEAGVPVPRLLSLCASLGLSGAECLAGIPGTVGGAAAMNAGGRYGAMADIVDEATVISRDGTVLRLRAAECGFRYRGSNLEEFVVLSVGFRLAPSSRARVRERTAAILAEKARAQPLRAKSCGCVFKNPPGLCAAKLIDEAGLKGLRRGGASISERHAGFMVNNGSARRRDFDELIAAARAAVRRSFGVELELEVKKW